MPLHSSSAVSGLHNRVDTPTTRRSLPAVTTCALPQDSTVATDADRKSERYTQIKSLIVGTLLFVPFLIVYFVAGSNQ